MRVLLAVFLLGGCEVPPTAEPEPVVEQAPKPEPEPVKKKKPRLTYPKCQEINAQFIQCGWRCLRGRSGTIDGCIHACKFLLTNRGKRCFRRWGPGFG